MSLLTYKDARPWAKAIKNAVVTRNDAAMVCGSELRTFPERAAVETSDIDTIARWADAGAPEGDAKDAPPRVQWAGGGWQIKPDYIVEGPTYDVPPKGIVEWTWFVVPGGFTKDTWVTSIEVLPSQLAVTHHVCLSYIQHTPRCRTTRRCCREASSSGMQMANEIPRRTGRAAAPAARARAGVKAAERFPEFIGVLFGRSAGTALIEECYEPGRPPADFRPYNAAKLIPAGTDIAVNVHYTPNGTAVATDTFASDSRSRRNRRSGATSQ